VSMSWIEALSSRRGTLTEPWPKGEVAVAVGVAEIAPVEGGLAALDAFGGEVAAGSRRRCGRFSPGVDGMVLAVVSDIGVLSKGSLQPAACSL